MATQKEVAGHIDLTDRQVRNLLKDGVLPGSKGRGGLDLEQCRLAYIRYLRGLATGQAQSGGDGEDLVTQKQKLEVAKLQHQVDELERAARKDDRQWVRHEDHCAALASLLAILKENLQHYSTIGSDAVVDVCGGSLESGPAVSDKILDAVIAPAFNDLAGARIEEAFFDVYSDEDDYDGGE